MSKKGVFKPVHGDILQQHRKNTLPRPRSYMKFGAAALTVALATGALAFKQLDQSGDILRHEPVHPLPNNPRAGFRFGSFNTEDQAYKKARQIAAFAQRNHLDAIALQEVSGDDAKKIKHSKYLDRYRFRYIKADTLGHPAEGGYGNMLLTRVHPYDVTSVKIPGTTKKQTTLQMYRGLRKDISNFDMSFKEFKDGRQEDRAALYETIDHRQGDKTYKLRIGTAHIAGSLYPSLHTAQFRKLMHATDEDKRSGVPEIMMLDSNARYLETAYAFGKIGMMTVGPLGPTGLKHHEEIDHGVYSGIGTLGVGTGYIDHELKSDHFAIVNEWPLAPPVSNAP